MKVKLNENFGPRNYQRQYTTLSMCKKKPQLSQCFLVSPSSWSNRGRVISSSKQHHTGQQGQRFFSSPRR
jgi:hypothetical protein